jgi:tetratricopeptide (TPR) repeat protein
MEVTYRAAVGVPVSFEGFRMEIGRKGFDHAADIYAAFLKQKPDFKLDEEAAVSWADELIEDDHLPEAIFLLKLNVQMHPDMGAAYVSLGDTYASSGQSRLAIETYKRSLEMDPIVSAAHGVARKITQLEGSSPKISK